MKGATMNLACVFSALLVVASVCNGGQSMVEEKAQQVRDTVTVGMSRGEAEAALHDLNATGPRYLSRDALTRLYGEAWARENPDLGGRLFAAIERVATHSVTVTDLSIEIDIDKHERVSEVRVKRREVGP